MIIKDEAEDAQLLEGFQLPPPLLERPGDRFTDFLAQRSNYRDREAHYDLRNNLIEHLWAKYGRDDVEDEESDSDWFRKNPLIESLWYKSKVNF